MIVQRVFHRVKPGRVGEFLDLMKSQSASALTGPTKRTYTAHIGPSGYTVCHELEFADLAELDQVWAAWWADPETPVYMEKFWALVEGGGHNEVWDLQE